MHILTETPPKTEVFGKWHSRPNSVLDFFLWPIYCLGVCGFMQTASPVKSSRPRSFSALQSIPAPSANGSDQLLDSATLAVPGRSHTYLWFEYVMIPSSCGEGLPSACLITRTSYRVEGCLIAGRLDSVRGSDRHSQIFNSNRWQATCALLNHGRSAELEPNQNGDT